MEKNKYFFYSSVLNSYSEDFSSFSKSKLVHSQSNLLRNVLNAEYFVQKFYNLSTSPHLITLYFKHDSEHIKYNTLRTLLPLNILPFNFFFRSNFIDTPQCLKINKSIKYDINKFELAKFANVLMRNGKKTYYLNLLMSSLNFVQENFNKTLYKMDFKSILILKNNFSCNNLLRLWSRSFFLKSQMLRNLNSLLPIFCFYIYRVKKKIYKNTRGKSGKYTFLWKYVPIYKRIKLVMFWLAKDFQTRNGNTNLLRLKDLINDLITNFTTLEMWYIKKFSHNYIYRNSKNTIGSSYRTLKR